MDKIHEEFPMYNWKKNKGYPTKEHREAIQKIWHNKIPQKNFQITTRTISLEFKKFK